MSAWAFLWMMLVLKIPLAAALWLVWWSAREQPVETGEEWRENGGGRGGHPRPRRPRPPRRGPHATPPPKAPQRVRARARRLTRCRV